MFPMLALVFAMATLMMVVVSGDVRGSHGLRWWSGSNKDEQERGGLNDTRATVPKTRHKQSAVRIKESKNRLEG